MTLKTDTNNADSRIDGAIQQAPDGKPSVARLTAIYTSIKDALSGFYIQRGVGIEAIVMLILVAAFGAMRVMQ